MTILQAAHKMQRVKSVAFILQQGIDLPASALTLQKKLYVECVKAACVAQGLSYRKSDVKKLKTLCYV